MQPVRIASAWWSMQRRLSINHIFVALAPPDDKIVGSVEVHSAEYLRRRAGDITADQAALLQPYLASLAVNEDVRSFGIGRALVEHAVDEMEALAAPGDTLLLQVETANTAAMRIYEACGFRVIGGGATVVMRRELSDAVEVDQL